MTMSRSEAPQSCGRGASVGRRLQHTLALQLGEINGAEHRATHDEKHRVNAFVLQRPCDQFVTKYL
jgi:hypothetical protein